jgi:hypothetical protein
VLRIGFRKKIATVTIAKAINKKTKTGMKRSFVVTNKLIRKTAIKIVKNYMLMRTSNT